MFKVISLFSCSKHKPIAKTNIKIKFIYKLPSLNYYSEINVLLVRLSDFVQNGYDYFIVWMIPVGGSEGVIFPKVLRNNVVIYNVSHIINEHNLGSGIRQKIYK